jgi:hypothetical protein
VKYYRTVFHIAFWSSNIFPDKKFLNLAQDVRNLMTLDQDYVVDTGAGWARKAGLDAVEKSTIPHPAWDRTSAVTDFTSGSVSHWDS